MSQQKKASGETHGVLQCRSCLEVVEAIPLSLGSRPLVSTHLPWSWRCQWSQATWAKSGLIIELVPRDNPSGDRCTMIQYVREWNHLFHKHRIFVGNRACLVYFCDISPKLEVLTTISWTFVRPRLEMTCIETRKIRYLFKLPRHKWT